MKSLLLTTLVFATASSFADVKDPSQTQFSRETTLSKNTLRSPGISKTPLNKSNDKTKSEAKKSEVTTTTTFKPAMKASAPVPKAPVTKPALVRAPTPSTPLKQVPAKPPRVVQHLAAPAQPIVRPPAILRPPTPIIVRQRPTPALMQQVVANNRLVMQQNALARAWVDRRAQVYRANYAAQILASQQRYLAPVYLAPLRVTYRPWVPFGFAVYAWPVRPVAEFYTYFNNPCVSWFYNDYDAEFYRPYYSEYYQRYPDLAVGYNHVGIYFPTEQFINLNVALSGMPIEYQVHYRRSMNFLSERLIERAHGPLGRHEVLVNHYQMLPDNRAVVVEGFVDSRGQHVPFRALVDLNDANRSRLFAVGAWGDNRVPTPEETEDLYYLNDQVGAYGGTLEAPLQG